MVTLTRAEIIVFLQQLDVIDPILLKVVLEQALTQAIEFDLNREEMRARLNQLLT